MTGVRGQEQPTTEDLQRILEVARNRALSLRVNSYEADEVAQETALKLLLKWKTPSVRRARRWNDARWDGYIRNTARNVYRDLVKSHHRRLARQTKSLGRDIPVVYKSGAISAPASPMGVDAYMARAEIAEEILRLPKQQRAVAVRVYIEEKSVNEVAVELELQPQTVRKHLRAARAAIKQALAGADSQETLQ